MKCAVCNYKYDEWDSNLEKNISDDIKEFIKIEGNFITKTGYYHNDINEVSLYACPKCGTIKMERWF